MTTELDDDLVPETLALIDQYGLPASFVVDAGTFDDATSTWTPAAAPVVAKVTPPGPMKVIVDGVLTEKTVTYLAAKDLTFVPTISMQVSIDGRDFRLTAADAIYSGTLVCIYKLVLD